MLREADARAGLVVEILRGGPDPSARLVEWMRIRYPYDQFRRQFPRIPPDRELQSTRAERATWLNGAKECFY